MKRLLPLVLAALLAPSALGQGMTITQPSGTTVTIPARPTTSPAASTSATAAPVPADLPAGWRVLTGRVRAPSDVRLPAGSLVTVSIEDVSRQDAPAVTVVTATFPTPRLSTPYTLQYNGSRFSPRRTLAVRARVTGPDGRLLYTTTTRQLAPTLPGARLDVQVSPVR